MSLLSASANVQAESLTLAPVADTSLVETAPDNDLGGQAFLVAGVVESGGELKRLRGLVRFDLSQIPVNAKVSNATFAVSVVLSNPDPIGELLYLRRMLQPWTEGGKSGGTDETGPLGEPATDGEPTWNHRQHPGVTWGAPGAGGAVDIASSISGIAFVYSVAEYTFSSAQLTSDVQQWVTTPATNHGWMLVAGIETTVAGGAARRFGSREDALHAPRLTVTYGIPRPVIATSSPLPAGVAGSPYQLAFLATGSTPPYTWSLDSGTLPDGLNLGSGGVLSGTPTEPGTFDFRVRVADSAAAASTNDFVLTINPAPLSVTTTTIPAGRVGVPYTASLNASGGTPPYAWSLYSGPRHLGNLPAGFSLSSDGVVLGAPTEALQVSFEVQVADSLGANAYMTFQLLVESLERYLTQSRIDGDQFSFRMTVNAGHTNVVQFRDQFGSGDWATLTTIASPILTNVTITDPATQPARFYRFYSTNASTGGPK